MYPETIINKFVWDQFRQKRPGIYSKYNVMPIFPVDDIQAGDSAWDGKTHIIYDSMARPRNLRKQFYPVKYGQMLYSVKGNINDIFEWRDFLVDMLDREDAVAQEVNEFAGTLNNDKIYFHSLCAYQSTYINTSYKSIPTQRKDQTTDIIIPFEYHKISEYA